MLALAHTGRKVGPNENCKMDQECGSAEDPDISLDITAMFCMNHVGMTLTLWCSGKISSGSSTKERLQVTKDHSNLTSHIVKTMAVIHLVQSALTILRNVWFRV